jgi:hypothetical protein
MFPPRSLSVSSKSQCKREKNSLHERHKSVDCKYGEWISDQKKYKIKTRIHIRLNDKQKKHDKDKRVKKLFHFLLTRR